jgi:hypothetical protein
VDWIFLALDKDWWWACVNMIMNLPVTTEGREFLDWLSILQIFQVGALLQS